MVPSLFSVQRSMHLRFTHQAPSGCLQPFTGKIMLFIDRWEISQTARKAAIERFLKTGGAPPAGVKMLGRWHTADGDYGFAIAETDDAQAIGKWALAVKCTCSRWMYGLRSMTRGMGAVLTSAES